MPSVPMLKTFPGRYATTSRQLHRRDLRGAVRHLGISALAAKSTATGRLRELLARPRVQILLLHHVMEDEQVPFRTLLRALSKDHVFIKYGEAVDRIERGAIDEPAIAITFDDGQRSCLQAVRIMSEFGISACFFVCPSMIGVTDYHRIRAFCASQLEIAPVPFMSWDEVESLVRAGHEIGSHTVSHPDLARLDPAEADEEIERSREMLNERLGPGDRHFAWPYGGFQHFTEHAARTVFRTGHLSCASGVRGAHEPGNAGDGPPCLRREHVMACWPVTHSLYLLARSLEHRADGVGRWPEGWSLDQREAAPPLPTPE